ncbi:MAG: hypothetical protein AAGG59_09530 [Bacteroidota bacterium]
MVKKHFKELTIIVGLIVALLLTNYICLKPLNDDSVKVKTLSIDSDSKYVPMLTELFILSAKLILRPLN